jgi:hypothetical protein
MAKTAFNKSDLESLVNALSALGANSEQDAKVPSDVISELTSPKDNRLMVWLSELEFPGLKKDREFLAPFLDWNRMLEMWLQSGAVDRFASSGLEAVQPTARSAAGPKTRARAGAVRPKAEPVARKTTKAKRPARKKMEANAVAREATLSDMVANIKTEFGLGEKLTMIETIVEAELQLNVVAGGASVKERAHKILNML